MRGRWSRLLGGRSLLRERAVRGAHPIGDCPRCGDPLTAPTECWLDAERVVTEHLQSCPGRVVEETAPPIETSRVRHALRLA
jgi:hypothetical protein